MRSSPIPGRGLRAAVCVLSACAVPAVPAQTAPEPGAVQLETMEVIGTTPVHGVGLPREQVPANVQTATGEDLRRSGALDLADFMARRMPSVQLNQAQGNPLQPDFQYRGFTASPLLGLPQGIAVYQNGVRVNEPFGDTVNWDLIPETAIANVNLVPGSNPLFGLNTLGGALSVRMKDGFGHPGHRAVVSGGSYGRRQASVESGASSGAFGYFATGSWWDEDGWRDFSDSEALNFFGSVGWRGANSTLDLSLTAADTELRGNGALPVGLLAIDRSAVFTHPDITENALAMLTLEGTHWLNNDVQLAGVAYYRRNDSDSFNGDGTEFDECEGTSPETAALADPDDFRCEDAGEDDEARVRDVNGNLLTEDDDAINNISTREQDAWGGSVQATLLQPLAGRRNQLIVGAAFDRGEADFASRVEAARLDATRGTTPTGRDIPGEEVAASTRTRTWGVFFTDTVSLTDALALTLGARFNRTEVRVRDLTGNAPELNGDHRFQRLNPAAGLTFAFHPAAQVYLAYNESSRAPTPVELACADPAAPCNLPNAFLADPPLEQVVAKTVEGGLRGRLADVEWSASAYRSRNQDDILFISTGGVTANEGFFDNIGTTRRQGIELGLHGRHGPADWFVAYGYLDATFRTAFAVSSPNHPLADADGEIQVRSGDRIPGLARHNLKFGADVEVLPGLSVGFDTTLASDQVLRGDEANLLDTVGGYAVTNLRGRYQVSKHVGVFARVDNVFDTDYETFGLLGDPGEVLGPAFTDPRFLGVGAERGAWIGLEVAL